METLSELGKQGTQNRMVSDTGYLQSKYKNLQIKEIIRYVIYHTMSIVI